MTLWGRKTCVTDSLRAESDCPEPQSGDTLYQSDGITVQGLSHLAEIPAPNPIEIGKLKKQQSFLFSHEGLECKDEAESRAQLGSQHTYYISNSQ